MSAWKAFWAAGLASLASLAVWHNWKVYKNRSWTWISFKSLIDLGIVVGLALRLPVLLCGYVILWLTKPLKAKPVIRTTISVLIGIAVSFFSGFAMEVIVVAGVFAADLITGGIWKYWNEIGRDHIDWRAEIGLRKKLA